MLTWEYIMIKIVIRKISKTFLVRLMNYIQVTMEGKWRTTIDPPFKKSR